MEALLKRLLSGVPVSTSTPSPHTGITRMETLLQHLQPGVLSPVTQARLAPARRDWSTMMCFSCGKPDLGVGQCQELDETFPYMLPGWSMEKVGSNYVVVLPRIAAERRCCGLECIAG